MRSHETYIPHVFRLCVVETSMALITFFKCQNSSKACTLCLSVVLVTEARVLETPANTLLCRLGLAEYFVASNEEVYCTLLD